MHSFLQEVPAEVVVCPEADIPVASAVTYRNAWRGLGWHALLSAPEADVCRVALLSRFPCKQVSLTQSEAGTRHVAALIDFQGPGGQRETLLAVGVYFQAGHEPTASGQTEAVLQAAVGTGFRFVMLGDFNLTPSHHTILEYLDMAPIVHCDDCQRGPPLPPTGPSCMARDGVG